MPKVNIILDATMLDTFLSCPAKYNYRFRKLKVTTTKAKPLDRGSLVHMGEEGYWKGLATGKNFDERIKLAVNEMHLASIDSDMDADEVSRTIDVTIESMKHWRNEDEEFRVKAVEEPFVYLLYEDDNICIYMMGKIDLLADFRNYSDLVMDHKSYERDFPLKRTANQFSNYVNAIGSNYLLVNRVGFQKSLTPPNKHKRIMLTYDPAFLEQWKNNVVSIIKNEYLRCTAENNWPMNFTSCDKFNRLCEYHDVCDTSGEANKEYKLNMHFADGEIWDVSALLSGSKKKKDE